MKILIIAIALIVLAGIIRWLQEKKKKNKGDWPYYAQRLMSLPEQSLYFRLVNALPDNLIFCQVQIIRFIGTKKVKGNYWYWWNLINRLSADFVICNKAASVIAVIELDDSSHFGKKAKYRDLKKDKAIEAAGIKLIRWNVKSLPTDEEIKKAVLELKTDNNRIPETSGLIPPSGLL